ncbi:MAG: FUSC family protein [Rubrobacteraceae bacterium]|nr:FUSC family protein [Rubrobacteraceae bacterium]
MMGAGVFRDLWFRAGARTLRYRMAGALGRLRANGGLILRKAVAAGVAWGVAHVLLGHQNPSFAAIAAIISLGAAAGREGRQAVELVLGVACGLAIADVFVSAIGSGAVQIGVVVALATAVALLIGESELLVTEAAVSALLMVTLVPASPAPFTGRFLDALIGSGMALAVRAVFPENPRRKVREAARPVFGELAGVLEEVAGALEAGDLEWAERALGRARAMDGRVEDLREALSSGYGASRLSPARRRALGELGFYSTAAGQLDLAVRNVRVLARAARALIRSGHPRAQGLPAAVRQLAGSVGALGVYLERLENPGEARALALEAAAGATAVLVEHKELETSMLVGQIRSTAVDLLQASGMSYTESLQALDEAAIKRTSEVQSAR